MTNWLERRITEHETGINETCYTHGRRPLNLVYSECHQYVWNAIKREKQIKNWSRAKKIALINGDFATLKFLSSCKNPSHHANNKIDKSILSRKLQKRSVVKELNSLSRMKLGIATISEINLAKQFFSGLRYEGCAKSFSSISALADLTPRFLVRPSGVEGDKRNSRATNS